MKFVVPLLLLIVILALAAGLVYLFAIPQIDAVEPADGTSRIHPGTDLRITFSRQMNPQSVLDHLKISPPTDGDLIWEGKTLIFRPRGGWQNGIEVLVELAAGSTADGLLSLAVRQDFQSRFKINNPRIAYLYPASGLASLYTIQPVSGIIDILVTFPAGILDYDLSPDQETIFFSGRNPSGGSDLFAINLVLGEEDTTEPIDSAYYLVLPCQKNECRAVTPSPQGDYLAFEKTTAVSNDGLGVPQVWLVELSVDGTVGEPYLVSDSNHQTLLPSWSPEGTLVYYDNNDSAFVFFDPRQNLELNRVSNESGEPGSWSPDGSVYVVPQFYFLDDNQPGVTPVINSRLHAYRWQDAEVIDLSNADDLDDSLPSFSPDGKYLAFARRFLNITLWTPGKQIWIIPFNNKDSSFSTAAPLTNAPYHTHYDFAWSPGSDQVAFVRFEQTTLTEPPVIWLIDLLTLQEKQLIIGGHSPRWIP